MYDTRIALCDEWKSRFSFVLDWITLSRAWCATRARRSSRLAVLRPPDEKERRRPDNPDIDITCFRREEEGGGGQPFSVVPGSTVWWRRGHVVPTATYRKEARAAWCQAARCRAATKATPPSACNARWRAGLDTTGFKTTSPSGRAVRSSNSHVRPEESFVLPRRTSFLMRDRGKRR